MVSSIGCNFPTSSEPEKLLAHAACPGSMLPYCAFILISDFSGESHKKEQCSSQTERRLQQGFSAEKSNYSISN
jgi:hypothetical protein